MLQDRELAPAGPDVEVRVRELLRRRAQLYPRDVRELLLHEEWVVCSAEEARGRVGRRVGGK